MDIYEILNISLCLLILAGIGFEAFLIYKRNRSIWQAGKDDFVTMMLVVLFIVLIFPLNNITSEIEAMRNILILMFIFGSFAIKRGINENGIVKIFFIIPWRSIRSIHVDQHQLHQARITFKADKYSVKLIFPIHSLARTLDYISNYCPTILVESSVQEKMKSMPQL